MSEPITFTDRAAVAWNGLVERSAKFAGAAYPALVIAVAVFAFFMQPVLRFMAYYPAYEGSLALGMGLILVRVASKMDGDVISFVAGFAGVGIGAFWLTNAIDAAVVKASTNDKRCYAIEQVMLSKRAPRSDLADLFNALGCRAQGTQDYWTERFPS
jgi:hypothetical protein